jgi:hypothetical protein
LTSKTSVWCVGGSETLRSSTWKWARKRGPPGDSKWPRYATRTVTRPAALMAGRVPPGLPRILGRVSDLSHWPRGSCRLLPSPTGLNFSHDEFPMSRPSVPPGPSRLEPACTKP